MSEIRQIPKMRIIKDAALELNIPEYALRRWVKDGTIKAVRCGRKQLVNLDRIIDYLEKCGEGDE